VVAVVVEVKVGCGVLVGGANVDIKPHAIVKIPMMSEIEIRFMFSSKIRVLCISDTFYQDL